MNEIYSKAELAKELRGFVGRLGELAQIACDQGEDAIASEFLEMAATVTAWRMRIERRLTHGF